jgi:hypothetical protein
MPLNQGEHKIRPHNTGRGKQRPYDTNSIHTRAANLASSKARCL